MKFLSHRNPYISVTKRNWLVLFILSYMKHIISVRGPNVEFLDVK